MRAIMILGMAACLAGTALAGEAIPLFVIVYHQGPSWQPELPMEKQPGIAAHAAYMKKLFEDGHSFAAGPTTDTPGGLLIFRAQSFDEARALMAADPAVTSGLFNGEVHAWSPRLRSDKPLP